jgi:hypothetical protein
VPYSWEADSDQQSGWYCLFTEDFIQHSERVNNLRDSPLFKVGCNPVFFPDEVQLREFSAIFQKMQAEMHSTYPHKYDVLRSYLHLLIHEAMKNNPATNFHTYANASSRVSALFLELLERQFPIDSPRLILKLKNPADYADALSVHINQALISLPGLLKRLRHYCSIPTGVSVMLPTAWALNTLHILHCSLKNTPVQHLLN